MDHDKINEEARKEELKKIQQSLKEGGLSRRIFLDRMKVIGVGFGAAFLLGVKDADAAVNTEAAADVTSTNPALDEILAEAKEAHAEEGDEGEFLSAQRRYRRGYRRYGRAYRRGYRRVYRRGYRRYGRVYRRGYRRGYRRFYARF